MAVTKNKTKKKFGFKPSFEAMNKQSKNVGGATFESAFLNLKTHLPNVGDSFYFRLLPCHPEVIEEMGGNLPVMKVKKYSFPHYELKEDGKPKWTVHLATYGKDGQKDDFYHHMKDRLEDFDLEADPAEAAEEITKFRHLFRYANKKGSPDFQKFPENAGRYENWINILPVSKKTERTEDGESAVIPSKPVILDLPWSIYQSLFGSGAVKGKVQDTDYYDEDGDCLFYLPYGRDLKITRLENRGNAAQFSLDVRPKDTLVEDTSFWEKEEELPNWIAEAKKGFNSNVAHVFDVHLGFAEIEANVVDEAEEEDEEEDVKPRKTLKKRRTIEDLED